MGRGHRHWIEALALAAGLSCGLATWACSKLEAIDGSAVAKIGSDASPPTCDQACRRVAALCGYEPVDCRTTCADDTTGEWRVCLGGAPSCRTALQECVAPAPEDGGEDAGEEDAGEDDASVDDASADDASDAGETDAATDAATDAQDAAKDAADAG